MGSLERRLGGKIYRRTTEAWVGMTSGYVAQSEFEALFPMTRQRVGLK